MTRCDVRVAESNEKKRAFCRLAFLFPLYGCLGVAAEAALERQQDTSREGFRFHSRVGEKQQTFRVFPSGHTEAINIERIIKVPKEQSHAHMCHEYGVMEKFPLRG